jgi:hypothetical protein
LLSAKNGVRNYAIALTEATTPEVRTFLRSQLQESLALHQEISELMMSKKWFHPYELHEQYQLDMLSANNTVQIAQLKLFPDDTSRNGQVTLQVMPGLFLIHPLNVVDHIGIHLLHMF